MNSITSTENDQADVNLVVWKDEHLQRRSRKDGTNYAAFVACLCHFQIPENH